MHEGYEVLAQVYDALTDDIDYAAWAKHYRDLLGVSNNPVESVLDIGCGTGNMSLCLRAMGFAVTGMDISEDMLRVARDKAAGLSDLPFVRMDMRAMRLPGLYDAMVCANDGVNYLHSEKDLAVFFAGAHQWLVPGGALAFDISSPAKLRALDGQVFFDDREDITLLWNNALDGDCACMDITLFLREKDGRYRRVDECHRQRIWEEADILSALEAAGFEGIRVFGGREMRPPKPGDDRLHFAARKPGEL